MLLFYPGYEGWAGVWVVVDVIEGEFYDGF